MLLLKDLRGILLEKTKEEVRVLRARLHECSLGKPCDEDVECGIIEKK